MGPSLELNASRTKGTYSNNQETVVDLIHFFGSLIRAGQIHVVLILSAGQGPMFFVARLDIIVQRPNYIATLFKRLTLSSNCHPTSRKAPLTTP